MNAFWCEQAWLGTAGAADGVVITVDDGTIGAIEQDVTAPPDGATRLDGVTLPGFANAHSHAFHRALRGRTHGGGGTFWTWRDQMYKLAARLDPDTYEALATATFAEMVTSGYTAVGEFHYLHHGPGGVPYADPNEMGRRLINAASRAGIRITLLDACYLQGGIGEPLNEVQQRFSDGTAERWLARMAGLSNAPMSRIGASIHSVRAVDLFGMTVVKWSSDARHQVVHAHVSEQPQENDACLEAYGGTPVEVLAGRGVLGDRFTAVHATHVTSSDVRLLADSRSRTCVCPTTERDLADGIGPTAALCDAGVALCIGSDSHAVVDPFEETRAVELDERLASLRRGTHSAADLLTAATSNGYASLGWHGGSLAPGMLADFVTVGFDSPRLAGADRHDVAAAVVFGASPSDVRHVIVGGEPIVRDGMHRSIDVVSALDASIRRAWAAVTA